MKISEKLTQRLKTELGLDVHNIERIPRGRHQAAAGQFAWIGTLSDKTNVGSEDTMTQCVKAKFLLSHRPIEFSQTINVTAENR